MIPYLTLWLLLTALLPILNEVVAMENLKQLSKVNKINKIDSPLPLARENLLKPLSNESALQLGRKIATKVMAPDGWSILQISRYYLPGVFWKVKSFRTLWDSPELQSFQSLNLLADLSNISKRYILQGFLAKVIQVYLGKKRKSPGAVIQSRFEDIITQNTFPGGFLNDKFVIISEEKERVLLQDISSYVKNPPTGGNGEDDEIQYLLLFQLLNIIMTFPLREPTESKQIIKKGVHDQLLFLSNMLITLRESTVWLGIADILGKIHTSPSLEVSDGELKQLKSYGITYEHILNDEDFKDDMLNELSVAFRSYQILKKNKNLKNWVESIPFLSKTWIAAFGQGKKWSKRIRYYENYQASIMKVKNTYENLNQAKRRKEWAVGAENISVAGRAD